ncbi:MAG: AI-2E family transporter [Christensenellales bacterium]
MESSWATKNKRTILWALLWVLCALALYTVRRDLIATLLPFLYAAVFAFLIDPLISRLEKRGIKRIWSSLATVLLIFILMLLFFLIIIPSLIRDFSQTLSNLTGGMANLQRLADEALHYLKDLLGSTVDLDARLSDLGDRVITLLSDALSRLIASLGSLLDVLLIPVITYYYLKDKDRIFAGALRLVSPLQKGRMQALGREINKLLSGYVQGKLIISAVVGLATGLGCLLLGLPHALTIGITAGIFDLVPYFGPWLGGVLPVVIALIGPTPGKALGVLFLILVIQQVESNLITPRVISRRVGLHPLAVMFSVMFFGAVLGIPGMVLGVPIMTVLLALLRYLRRQAANPPAAEEGQSPDA